jgi:hypothetical protein
MKLIDLLNEVKIDNKSGIGEVPDNRNVDYLGLRVKMKPSVFLKLASPLSREQARSVDYIKQQLDQGQGIASPWLVIDIPVEWDNGSLEKPARVTAHEGRNRMYAVLEKEGDVPVETHLFFAGGLRARHIKPEWIEALNSKLVPQRTSTTISGPFFEIDSKLDERKGAPGTLKAKITRLYGGDVTCAKTQKLKTRKGATTLDKRQANWFQNKHCDGATRVDEIISGEPIPGDWKKYGSGDAEMFETEFEFQAHKITISVSRDWAQSGAYVLMKKNIEPKADLVGREIIFRVDGETDSTGLLGTGAAGVMSTVVGKIVGLLKNISWDYLVFAGAGDRRQRLYTKILERLAPVLDAESMQFGDWFLLIKNHVLAPQDLEEVFKGSPIASQWERAARGTYLTKFEFAGHMVGVAVIENGDYNLELILKSKNNTVPEHWKGYEVAFDVDDVIDATGELGPLSTKLFGLVIRRLQGFFLVHPWDYIEFSGAFGSRNKLYHRLANKLAAENDARVLHHGKSFAVLKNRLFTQSASNLDEAFDYTLPRNKWEIIGSGDNYITFEFDIDENIYTLESLEIRSPQKGIYDVYFSHKEHGLDISGTGSAFKVFSAVHQLIRWVINHQKQYGVKGLYFSAREPSRRKLYNKLAPLMAQQLGWKFTTEANKMPYGASNKESGYLLLDPTIAEAGGVGTVVKGVNTTADVGPDAVQKQARKFLNKVSRTGVPPQIQSNGKFSAPK